MPPQSNYLNPDSSDSKFDVYVEKQGLLITCGIIMMAAYEALETNDLVKLKLIISQFCYEDSTELIDMNFQGLSYPFKGFKPYQIVREPDQVRENTLIDENVENVSCECPCQVTYYAGQLFVRWTMPRIEYVWQCNSAKKLAHTAMVIVEELMHIRQMVTPNTRALLSISTMLEFDAVQSTGQMDESDLELLSQVLETDVTFFFDTYLKKYIDKLQWFKGRAEANDFHETMTPQKYIEAIMYLTTKYGYPDELGDILMEEITHFASINPELGNQMFLANGLGDFVKSSL